LFYNLYLWKQAFEQFNMGYASAMAWLLFAAVMVITLLNLRLSKKWVYYEGGE
jgi:multiple sugar transport system permease protein